MRFAPRTWMGQHARTAAGSVGLTLAVSLIAVGVVGARDDAPPGDGPLPPAGVEPQSDHISEQARSRATALLMRSAEFGSLAQRLRNTMAPASSQNFRPLLIEGEVRGVTFEMPLDRAVTANGPWTKVDKVAMLQEAGVGKDLRALPHDERAEALGDVDLRASDYPVTRYDELVTTDRVFVAVDLVDGRVLAVEPAVKPPTLSSGEGAD